MSPWAMTKWPSIYMAKANKKNGLFNLIRSHKTMSESILEWKKSFWWKIWPNVEMISMSRCRISRYLSFRIIYCFCLCQFRFSGYCDGRRMTCHSTSNFSKLPFHSNVNHTTTLNSSFDRKFLSTWDVRVIIQIVLRFCRLKINKFSRNLQINIGRSECCPSKHAKRRITAQTAIQRGF